MLLAQIRAMAGDPRAVASFEQAIDFAIQSGSPIRLVWAHRAFASHLREEGRHAESARHLALVRQHGAGWDVGWIEQDVRWEGVLNLLGEGRFDEAGDGLGALVSAVVERPRPYFLAEAWIHAAGGAWDSVDRSLEAARKAPCTAGHVRDCTWIAVRAAARCRAAGDDARAAAFERASRETTSPAIL
jgi:hypothetical protein